MTEAEFAAAHPGPFLAFDVPPDDDDLNFLTELPNVPATRKNVAVAAIRRRAPGASDGGVTVGRAVESDVSIRDASVSKLHAHFDHEGGALRVTDLGSHNGTKVDGVVVPANAPFAVKAGATIVFGSVAARVLDAKSAYELLRR